MRWLIVRFGAAKVPKAESRPFAPPLANDPHVILADEPTGNLDTEDSQRAFGLLDDLVRERDKALLLGTHNRFIADACDWLHEMKDGVIVKSHPHGERISVS